MWYKTPKPETLPRYGNSKGFRVRNKSTGKKHKRIFRQLSDAELYIYRMGDENNERFEIISA